MSTYLGSLSQAAPFLPPSEAPERCTEALEKGGLGQIISSRGGSRTHFAFSCLGAFLKKYTGAPPLSIWISEEGFPYPALLRQHWNIPLSRFLLVQVPTAAEVWRAGLESIQSGLFEWFFFRVSQACQVSHLRKLQLGAERAGGRVFLLCPIKLPHWPLKFTIEV